MKDAERLLQFLSKNKRSVSPLLILTHDYPDPDSMASAFALHYLAKNQYGIDSKIVYGGLISRIENRYMVNLLKIPLRKLKGSDLKKFSHYVLVDTQPGFGNNSFPKDRQATIVIDQHPSISKPEAELAIVNTRREATCEILAQALLSLKKEIPANIATALIYGILADTLNLSRARSRATFRIYLALLSHCDIKTLVRIQNPPRSKEFFTMLRRAIELASVHGSVIFCHLGFIQDPIFVAHTADFLLNYKGMRWAFCSGRYKGKLFISLRAANPDALACEVLRDVVWQEETAGGHGSIAGGSLEVGKDAGENVWISLEKKLIQRMVKRLHISVSKQPTFVFKK